MFNMEKLVNDLTQKDEAKALKAAQDMINGEKQEAFDLLCKKSEYLFDFVKNNIRKRLKKAINKDNYKKIQTFFNNYNEEYADLFIDSIAQFANEELSDDMYEILENGTIDQKKYAAKYFYYIPDTIAQEKLEDYAFSDELQLAVNSAQALGAMNDRTAYEKAVTKLKSDDDFEVMKSVRFLTSFGDKKAVGEILKTLETTAMAENISAELPYLMPILDMFETQEKSLVLSCFDFILAGLGEILPLSQVFDFEVFEVLQYLIKRAQNESDSQVSAVLLRALEKFSTLVGNDEYMFDEAKDLKDEIKAINDLLALQSKAFWIKQRNEISNELTQRKQRAISALEVIRALEIKEAENAILKFINEQTDEQLLVLAVGVAKILGLVSRLNSAEICEKIKDNTSKAIVTSYFMTN